MNLINKAIRDAMYGIPREILKMAYLESSTYNLFGTFKRTNISLDEAIREMTIQPRVIVDCSIVGGQMADINLEGLAPVLVDEMNHAYYVPPDRTQGRTILSVMSVNYFRTYGLGRVDQGVSNTMASQVSSELMSSNRKAMASRSDIPLIGTSDCKVLGNNVILVRTRSSTPTCYMARCLLAHDEDLSDVSIMASMHFSKLCSLAIKSFVYNELDIRIDAGSIVRGHEVGRIRARIDSYADAEEQYLEYLENEWAGVMAFSDQAAVEDLLMLQLNPGI